MSDDCESREYNDCDWPDKLAFELGEKGYKFVLVTATKSDHETRTLTMFGPAETLEILVKVAKTLSLIKNDHPSMWDGAFLISGGGKLNRLAASSLARFANDDRLYMLYLDAGKELTVCVRGEPFAVTHVVVRAAAMVEKSHECTFVPPPSIN